MIKKNSKYQVSSIRYQVSGIIVLCVFLFGATKAEAADTTIKGTGATSATAGLEVTNSSDTSLLYVRNDGNIGIGTTGPGAQLQVNASAATTIGQIIKGYASQSANLQEWQNSAGTVLSAFDETGKLALGASDPGNAQLYVNGLTYLMDTINIAATKKLTNYGGAASSYLDLYNSSSGNMIFQSGYEGADILFQTSSTRNAYDRNFIFTAEGNVGIGTTTPNNLLQVADLIDFNDTDYNVKLGYQAGKNIVAGANYNIFLGYQAGLSSPTGSTTAAIRNTAVGYRALYSNTVGYGNFALGDMSLYYNTEGYQNTAIGSYALFNNTIGYRNFAIGPQALRTNTEGNVNIAIGVNALYANTLGANNVAMGIHALFGATIANYNTGIGSYAGRAITTGDRNTAIGGQSLYDNITGACNVAIGYQALLSSLADYNVGVGTYAGRPVTTGSSNTFLGYYAGYHASQKIDAVNSMALGKGTYTTADNQVVLGNTSITETLLNGNVGIGTTTPSGSTTAGTAVLAIADGTAPVGGRDLMAMFYSDTVVTTSEMFVMNEAGITTQISPHDPVTGEWIFYSKNTHTGRVVRVDMERLVKAVERVTGEKFMVEKWEK